jgi:hypothetical protein
MNNTQLYLTIGIPSFVALISWITVVLAWLSNRSDMNRLADRLDSKIDRLDGKLDRLAEQQHKDAMMLQSYMIPLHERMAKLEHSN